VKRLRDELADQPEVRERFLAEARLAAGLDHPNILPVHAVGLDPSGTPLITMKLIEGGTLHDRLQQSRRPPRGEALFELVDILIQVCNGLARAHEHGVVHGDLKARNIMLDQHGAVFLVDWGNALPIGGLPPRDGRGQPVLLGTPSSMAPEQARGDTVDERTDVFGMGALLYTILARRVPYSRGGPEARQEAARTCAHKPIDTLARRAPEGLRAVVRRAMQPDPADRHPSISALRTELVAWRRGEIPAPSRRVTAGEVLIREGEASRALYIVEEGLFAVTSGTGAAERLLTEVGPGTVLGEIGLFARSTRTATVTARAPGQVRVISHELLEEELERLPEWMRAVIEVMASRLHQKLRSSPAIN
jgi:serine/threonine-protein kinase